MLRLSWAANAKLVAIWVLAGLVYAAGLLLPSFAFASSDDVSESVVEVTAQELGIEISDPRLAAVLEEGVSFAIEGGLISQDIVDAVSEVDANLSAEIQANLELQLANWDAEYEDLVEGFGYHRKAFEACRGSGDKTPAECAREMGLLVQAASAECTIMKIETFEESLVELAGQDLTQVEEEIALAEALLEKKLVRATATAEGAELGSERREEAEAIASKIVTWLSGR